MNIQIKQTNIFSKWFSKLKDLRAKAKILERIDRIKMNNFGDVKSIGDGLFEIRINEGKGYRIYYKRVGETIYILLIGGDKSTQAKDIKKAKEIAKNI